MNKLSKAVNLFTKLAQDMSATPISIRRALLRNDGPTKSLWGGDPFEDGSDAAKAIYAMMDKLKIEDALTAKLTVDNALNVVITVTSANPQKTRLQQWLQSSFGPRMKAALTAEYKAGNLKLPTATIDVEWLDIGAAQ